MFRGGGDDAHNSCAFHSIANSSLPHNTATHDNNACDTINVSPLAHKRSIQPPSSPSSASSSPSPSPYRQHQDSPPSSHVKAHHVTTKPSLAERRGLPSSSPFVGSQNAKGEEDSDSNSEELSSRLPRRAGVPQNSSPSSNNKNNQNHTNHNDDADAVRIGGGREKESQHDAIGNTATVATIPHESHHRGAGGGAASLSCNNNSGGSGGSKVTRRVDEARALAAATKRAVAKGLAVVGGGGNDDSCTTTATTSTCGDKSTTMTTTTTSLAFPCCLPCDGIEMKESSGDAFDDDDVADDGDDDDDPLVPLRKTLLNGSHRNQVEKVRSTKVTAAFAEASETEMIAMMCNHRNSLPLLLSTPASASSSPSSQQQRRVESATCFKQLRDPSMSISAASGGSASASRSPSHYRRQDGGSRKKDNGGGGGGGGIFSEQAEVVGSEGNHPFFCGPSSLSSQHDQPPILFATPSPPKSLRRSSSCNVKQRWCGGVGGSSEEDPLHVRAAAAAALTTATTHLRGEEEGGGGGGYFSDTTLLPPPLPIPPPSGTAVGTIFGLHQTRTHPRSSLSPSSSLPSSDGPAIIIVNAGFDNKSAGGESEGEGRHVAEKEGGGGVGVGGLGAVAHDFKLFSMMSIESSHAAATAVAGGGGGALRHRAAAASSSNPSLSNTPNKTAVGEGGPVVQGGGGGGGALLVAAAPFPPSSPSAPTTPNQHARRPIMPFTMGGGGGGGRGTSLGSAVFQTIASASSSSHAPHELLVLLHSANHSHRDVNADVYNGEAGGEAAGEAGGILLSQHICSPSAATAAAHPLSAVASRSHATNATLLSPSSSPYKYTTTVNNNIVDNAANNAAKRCNRRCHGDGEANDTIDGQFLCPIDVTTAATNSGQHSSIANTYQHNQYHASATFLASANAFSLSLAAVGGTLTLGMGSASMVLGGGGGEGGGGGGGGGLLMRVLPVGSSDGSPLYADIDDDSGDGDGDDESEDDDDVEGGGGHHVPLDGNVTLMVTDGVEGGEKVSGNDKNHTTNRIGGTAHRITNKRRMKRRASIDEHSLANIPTVPNAIRFAPLYACLPSNMLSIESTAHVSRLLSGGGGGGGGVGGGGSRGGGGGGGVGRFTSSMSMGSFAHSPPPPPPPRQEQHSHPLMDAAREGGMLLGGGGGGDMGMGVPQLLLRCGNGDGDVVADDFDDDPNNANVMLMPDDVGVGVGEGIGRHEGFHHPFHPPPLPAPRPLPAGDGGGIGGGVVGGSATAAVNRLSHPATQLARAAGMGMGGNRTATIPTTNFNDNSKLMDESSTSIGAGGILVSYVVPTQKTATAYAAAESSTYAARNAFPMTTATTTTTIATTAISHPLSAAATAAGARLPFTNVDTGGSTFPSQFSVGRSVGNGFDSVGCDAFGEGADDGEEDEEEGNRAVFLSPLMPSLPPPQ